MSHVDAQGLFAEIVNKLGATTTCCWWKLLGEDHNSLSRLFDVTGEEMRLMLRKCNVLYGAADSFRTTEFEKLMTACGGDYTTYRPSGKPVYFLKIGDKEDGPHAIEKPKDCHSLGGVLESMPILGEHLPGIHTKVSRRLVSKLMEGASPVNVALSPTDHTNNANNNGTMTRYINDLVDCVKKEVMYASRQGSSYTFTQRAERMVRKAAAIAVKRSVRDMVDAWVDRMSDEKEAEECVSTPAASNQMAAVFPLASQLKTRLFPSDTPLPASQETPSQEEAPLITPFVDLRDTDVEEEDERDIDLVLTHLKEETMLQNLLHKRMSSQRNRVITLEHKNGRKLRAILPPDTQSSKSFVEEAKKSRWITEMLHSDMHRRGMLLYLAQTIPDVYVRVANQKKITMQSAALNTPQTLALGRLTGINNTQMAKLRSFLRTVGQAELKFSKKEIARIDGDVGLNDTLPDPIFNTYTLEWATTSGKGAEKKPPENCSYWNTADLLMEVAAEIDLLMSAICLQQPGLVTPSLLDHLAPGFETSPGVTVLFGGDHGAGSCPCSLKINFSSPQERKERGDLSYRCPTIQIASIDCTKDSFELLSNTVMPRLREQLHSLRNSCALVAYSAQHPSKLNKAFLIPKTFCRQSIRIQHNLLKYRVGGEERTIDLNACFAMENNHSFASFRIRIVVSNFNDLCVGDLAFLAMVIGMNNSAGAHCIHCMKKATEFDCEELLAQDIRTKGSLTTCLNEYNTRKLATKSVRNHKGVNTIGMLDIDPQRIIVPTLHCPMGLVDKVLESFKSWSIYEAESLPDEANQIREVYKNAQVTFVQAIAAEDAARLADIAHNTDATAASYRVAKQESKEARTEQKKAKDNYDEMVKRHNSRIYSLSQSYDIAFRSHNIKKEHYHGGKYNGVNCMRIMEKAKELFNVFAALIKANKIDSMTEAVIEVKCGQFTSMLGLLDAIWSNVRGIDAGLLPTEAQIDYLRKATSKAKALWKEMSIGTLQPKWHLTFDGHLLAQVIRYGGLADKADDTIEFQHQMLMKLRDRFRSVTSYQRREMCIRKELRRIKSPEIQGHIDSYERARKRVNAANKRTQEAAERQQEERVAKRVKREHFVNG